MPGTTSPMVLATEVGFCPGATLIITDDTRSLGMTSGLTAFVREKRAMA